MSVVVLEAGSNVGGTWFWNRYPGARTDSESWVYAFSFSKELQDEWDWTERFPGQPETLAYLNFVADPLDLRRDVRVNARVASAVYDESANEWVVSTENGQTLRCTSSFPPLACSPGPTSPTSRAWTSSRASGT